jgi:hypothetical protein
MVLKNNIKRSYFLNLFTDAAEKTVNSADTKHTTFRWNIRDLQLGTDAEIGLVQMVHTNAANNTGYAIRCLETYGDGFDTYNWTSAILYLGMGMNAPNVPTYHKLMTQNLNTITLVMTDDLTSSTAVSAGITKNISLGIILEIIDYQDDKNPY